VSALLLPVNSVLTVDQACIKAGHGQGEFLLTSRLSVADILQTAIAAVSCGVDVVLGQAGGPLQGGRNAFITRGRCNAICALSEGLL
jgi:hypothetical protein